MNRTGIHTRRELFVTCLLLLAVMGAGLFLRVYDLGSESLWIDEALSVDAATDFRFGIDIAHPFELPIYHRLLHGWTILFGDSEFSMRLLSVLFGWLSLYLVYHIARELFDAKAGLISALLIAFSPFHIQYSQDIRNYSFVGLLGLFSMCFFIRMSKGKRRIDCAGYALSSILLVASSFFGFLIIAAQNIYIATIRFISKDAPRPPLRPWILVQSAMIIPVLACVPFIVKQISHVTGNAYWWIPEPTGLSIPVSLLEYAGSLPLLLVSLLFLMLSIVSFRRISTGDDLHSINKMRWEVSLKEVDKNYLLLIWLATPMVLLFVVSKYIVPIYWTRYTIAGSMAFFIAVGNGVRNIRSPLRTCGAVALIVALSIIPVADYYADVNKERWREAAADLATMAHKNDLIVFSPEFCQHAFDYYFKRQDVQKTSYMYMYESVSDENLRKLVRKTRWNDRVWVIISHSQDPDRMIEKTMKRSHDLVYHKTYESVRFLNVRFHHLINYKYTGIEVFLFTKKKKSDPK